MLNVLSFQKKTKQSDALCFDSNVSNDHIQKYHVIYSDNSEDYIGEDEIDMVEICVV